MRIHLKLFKLYYFALVCIVRYFILYDDTCMQRVLPYLRYSNTGSTNIYIMSKIFKYLGDILNYY